MLLKRFYDDHLAQASYLIGCAATGQALVVDPNRDIEPYLAAAEAEGLVITHVTETHIHADFVSGSRELAARTDAELLLSGEGGDDWQYGFAADAEATLLADGDVFHVGNIRLEVLHTPGHTPEHLSFLVTDTAATRFPMGMLSGDFVFVGDVGRPDLLEKAAHVTGSMESAARALFHSLARLRALPDHLQLWPGHGAGSACGKALGAVPQSSLGYERMVNWAFQIDDEDRFVDAVLEGQPEPPRYFAEMKRINRDGPRVLGGFPAPPHMHLADLERALEAGALVIDTRPSSNFAGGHVPGTINIPATRSFTTWAGWLVPYDRDFYLLTDAHGADVNDIVRHLAMIGLDRVAGYADESIVDAWAATDRPLGTIEQWRIEELADARDDERPTIVDVRWRAEWDAGHIPDAVHLPVPELLDRVSELPEGRLAVHCESGARSAIAASLIAARTGRRVVNVIGGFQRWAANGNRVVRGAARAGVA